MYAADTGNLIDCNVGTNGLSAIVIFVRIGNVITLTSAQEAIVTTTSDGTDGGSHGLRIFIIDTLV